MGLSIQDHSKSMRRAFPGFRIAKRPDGIVMNGIGAGEQAT